MDTILIVFLLPVFFMLHELEEIIGIRLWLDKNGAELYNRFPRFKQISRRVYSCFFLYIPKCIYRKLDSLVLLPDGLRPSSFCSYYSIFVVA